MVSDIVTCANANQQNEKPLLLNCFRAFLKNNRYKSKNAYFFIVFVLNEIEYFELFCMQISIGCDG
jgi:hypothetical protein